MIRSSKISQPRRAPIILLVLLATQAFAAFLSETKFLPSIKNNVGVFEVNAVVLFGAALVYYTKHRLPVRLHPIVAIMGVWLLAASLSQFQLPPDMLEVGLTATMILAFQLVFTVVLHNLLSLRQTHLIYLLRCVACSVAVIGLWVLVDQMTSNGDINAVGPFRNRTHMGIYMFSAFWMVMFYLVWPGISRRERWGLSAILALTLYAVAVSGRQSVYTGFIVGLAGLTLSFVVTHGRERFKISRALILASCLVVLFYLSASPYLRQLDFFRAEAATLGEKLDRVTAAGDNPEDAENFAANQRAAALRAFYDHPLLGIGWGGFYRSEYSPTGHEMHSTPLRFLAELGLIGVALYVGLMGYLLIGALRLFLRARKTPFQFPAWVLWVALCSLSVSQYYNRMFTDRGYWLVLVAFLGFEAFLLNQPESMPVTSQPPATRHPSDLTLTTTGR